MGNQNKIPIYINESRELGIEVLKPDINESYSKFTVINGKIRFALNSIKNVGENQVELRIANLNLIFKLLFFAHNFTA